MKKGFISIGAVVVVVALALGVVVGYKEYKNPAEETFSAFRPSSYTGKLLTRLNEGGSETTFNTTPGTAKDGSSLTTAKIGDFIVITINPGADNEEKISASAVSVSGTTATWTIINRGLSFTENAQVTANIKQHAIGETVIISNDDHYLYSQYVNVDDAQTISGIKTFSASPIVPTPTTDMQAATKKYADDLVIAGAPNAEETVKGISELATQIEMASSTNLGGTSASLVLQSQYATSTPTLTGLYIPVSENDGKLNQSWLDLSEVFSFSGNNSFSGTSLFAASSTFTATTTILADTLNRALVLNGLPYVLPSMRCASGQTLIDNGSGTLSCKYASPFSWSGLTASASNAGPGVGYGTSTIINLPNGLMTASSTIEVWIRIADDNNYNDAAAQSCTYNLVTSPASTTVGTLSVPSYHNIDATGAGVIKITPKTLTSQAYVSVGSWGKVVNPSGGYMSPISNYGTASANFGTQTGLAIEVRTSTPSGSCSLTEGMIVIIP